MDIINYIFGVIAYLMLWALVILIADTSKFWYTPWAIAVLLHVVAGLMAWEMINM